VALIVGLAMAMVVRGLIPWAVILFFSVLLA
jgi:hypothetical protein